jgi:hypothetical protein
VLVRMEGGTGVEGFGGLPIALGRGLYVSLICWPFNENEEHSLFGVSGAMAESARLACCSGVFRQLIGLDEGLMTGRVEPLPLELLECVGPSSLLPSNWKP